MSASPAVQGQVGARVFLDEEITHSKNKTRREIQTLETNLNESAKRVVPGFDIGLEVNPSLRTIRGTNIIDGFDVLTESDVLMLPLLTTVIAGVEDVVLGAEIDREEMEIDLGEEEAPDVSKEELFRLIDQTEDVLVSAQVKGRAGFDRPAINADLCVGGFTRTDDQEVRSHINEVRNISGLLTSEIDQFTPDAVPDTFTCINTKQESLHPKQLDKITTVMGDSGAFAIAKVNRRKAGNVIDNIT